MSQSMRVNQSYRNSHLPATISNASAFDWRGSLSSSTFHQRCEATWALWLDIISKGCGFAEIELDSGSMGCNSVQERNRMTNELTTALDARGFSLEYCPSPCKGQVQMFLLVAPPRDGV
jgi:hypothetical protein